VSLSLPWLALHSRRVSNKDLQIIEDRIEKKLSGWKEKMLSVGGRLVLINLVPPAYRCL